MNLVTHLAATSATVADGVTATSTRSTYRHQQPRGQKWCLIEGEGGFSLIEIAVVLAIAAAIGLVMWRVLPALQGARDQDNATGNLVQAQQALEGFILRENRLPCPAVDLGGVEDCVATNVVGYLPFKTMGLSASSALRYSAYRNPSASPRLDADLTAAGKLRYEAELPPSNDILPPPTPLLPQSNGLAFCVGVKNAINAAGGTAFLNADGLPMAYVIVHAGLNRQFDAPYDTVSSFNLSNAAGTNTNDDRLLNSGLSELFGRLNCPDRLSHANGAARSAFAAYEIDRSAALYAAYRTFVVRVAISDVAFATASLAIAVVDIGLAIAGAAVGIAMGIISNGLSVIITAVNVSLNFDLAVVSFVLATAALVNAGIALTSAQNQETAANDFRIITRAQVSAAYTAAQDAVKKGILP
jgi:type II secretory pathway pseudopilin PulG